MCTPHPFCYLHTDEVYRPGLGVSNALLSDVLEIRGLREIWWEGVF